MTEPRPSQPGPPRSVEVTPEHTPYETPSPSGAADVRAGGPMVHVSVSGPETIRIALDDDEETRDDFECAGVTRWCAETSALVEVTLDLAAGDDVRIRGPMLVGRGERCIAFARKITRTESELFIGVADSPGAMAREEHLATFGVSTAEGRRLLAVIGSAAAATRSHDARG